MIERKCYVVGGGLAALASAAYLVKDGGIPGKDVTVLEENGRMGGSLDADRISVGDGYVMRGYRMLEEKVYSCLFDLLSFIPSLDNPGKTVLQEFREFNERVKVSATSRLIADGRLVDPFPFDLRWKDRFRVLWFLIRSEATFEGMRIDEYFSPAFFTSNFWTQLCTTFSFQPWHSLAELRRYILRFYHDSPFLATMECVQLPACNEYESIILPLTKWLAEQAVQFVVGVWVVDFDFAPADGRKTVTGIHCTRGGITHRIEVGKRDVVFATLGSITSNSTVGSMDEAPRPSVAGRGPSWALWERLARKEPAFGTPALFTGSVEKSKWTSFTITLRGPAFTGLLESLTGRTTGTEGVITIQNSNWLISFAMTPFPFFRDQPEHVSVCWGYGLFPEKAGNYIGKKLSECSGREILVELCSHLGFGGEIDRILATSTCIPCLLPYVTSQFLPRSRGNRPNVVPRDIANLALLGQYCELADDIVFTLEYSVRSAQTGVYSRLHLDREVAPIYKGYRDPRHICQALKTLLKPRRKPSGGELHEGERATGGAEEMGVPREG
jgi:oleate hydratase